MFGAVVAAFVAALGWALYHQPWLWLVLLTLFAVVFYGSQRDRRHLRRLAAARPGEDIGTFARAFDRGEPFDPWVVRAVWETLQLSLIVDGRSVPIRPTDRIVEDLRLDWEDLDHDVAKIIAPRSGRTLTAVDQNPRFGHVETVGDLVRLLSSQRLESPLDAQ